jgi:C-terminal processing protease CtpA/Prc
MQLAMVGNERNILGGSSGVVEAMPVASGTSVGGSSRSKRGVSGRSSRSSPSANRRTVIAPPGKLGLILANKSDGKGTVVSGVRSGSALAESMGIGDRIIAVDGEDVSHINVAELTTIMTRKSDFERKLLVISFSKSGAPSPVSRIREM